MSPDPVLDSSATELGTFTHQGVLAAGSSYTDSETVNLPVGVSGSFEALPPGAILPRPKQITVNIGTPFRFERGTDGDAAAARIQQELAALLPASMQPLPQSVQRPPAA